jgi:hypothetical protein
MSSQKEVKFSTANNSIITDILSIAIFRLSINSWFSVVHLATKFLKRRRDGTAMTEGSNWLRPPVCPHVSAEQKQGACTGSRSAPPRNKWLVCGVDYWAFTNTTGTALRWLYQQNSQRALLEDYLKNDYYYYY